MGKAPVPPRMVVALTISSILTLVILGVSIVDLGSDSLFLAPTAAGITIVHHLVLLYLGLSELPSPTRPPGPPSSFTELLHVLFVSFLSLFWLAIAVSMALEGNLSNPRFTGNVAGQLDGSVLVQTLGSLFESLALIAFASMCFQSRADRHKIA